MGILKSCASSTKLYLVTPGIALMTADSLQSSYFTTALEEATCRYAHLLRRCSLRTTDASLRRSSGLRRTGRRRIGWLVGSINALIGDRREHLLTSSLRSEARRTSSTHRGHRRRGPDDARISTRCIFPRSTAASITALTDQSERSIFRSGGRLLAIKVGVKCNRWRRTLLV